MKLLKNILMGISILFLCASMSWSLPVINDLIAKQDEIFDLKTDISAKTTLVQQKVDQGTKSYEAIYYRRDSDDSFLIIMIAPDSDKGNGYLRVGDNFWMYRRNTRTFQHVNRDESISGTDAKGGDFEKRKQVELYKGSVDSSGKELISEEMLGKIAVYKYEIIAKVNDVTYPKQVYWVRKDNFLPLKVQSYSLSGTLMQTAYFLKYTIVNEKYVPLNQIFIDEFEKGNKTIMDISGISTAKPDDNIFTKGYLENLSK
jgi:outer membrane lipoprotein-sorting protein